MCIRDRGWGIFNEWTGKWNAGFIGVADCMRDTGIGDSGYQIGVGLIAFGKHTTAVVPVSYTHLEVRLHRLLETLFADGISLSERRNILQTEYQITMTEELEGRLNQMCNLGEGLAERDVYKRQILDDETLKKLKEDSGLEGRIDKKMTQIDAAIRKYGEENPRQDSDEDDSSSEDDSEDDEEEEVCLLYTSRCV